MTFSVTVRAVAPGSGIPTGTVTFTDGAVVLGTGSLNATGQATFTTSALSLGGHDITATYSGDTNFYGSASATFTQTVELGD